MPFFKPAKINMKDCVSLQVHKSAIYKERKRVYLFTSKGSVSIEAAIAISVFIMVVLFVENYLVFVNTEFSMQMKMNNVVKEVSQNMFYASVIEKISDKEDGLKEIENNQENIMARIKEGYLKARLFQEISWDSSNYFLGGIAGLNTTESVIKNGIVDLVATYKMEVPLVNRYMTFTQRSKMKGWDGVDISIPQEMVYITENGTVYHTTKDCSYLSIKVSKVTYQKCTSITNNSGNKYSKCSLCVNVIPKDNDSLFVTEDGNRYHTNLRCSGLTRKIIILSKDDVKDMPVCNRCGKEDNDN